MVVVGVWGRRAVERYESRAVDAIRDRLSVSKPCTSASAPSQSRDEQKAINGRMNVKKPQPRRAKKRPRVSEAQLRVLQHTTATHIKVCMQG
jgi:hypothetical protein